MVGLPSVADFVDRKPHDFLSGAVPWPERVYRYLDEVGFAALQRGSVRVSTLRRFREIELGARTDAREGEQTVELELDPGFYPVGLPSHTTPATAQVLAPTQIDKGARVFSREVLPDGYAYCASTAYDPAAASGATRCVEILDYRRFAAILGRHVTQHLAVLAGAQRIEPHHVFRVVGPVNYSDSVGKARSLRDRNDRQSGLLKARRFDFESEVRACWIAYGGSRFVAPDAPHLDVVDARLWDLVREIPVPTSPTMTCPPTLRHAQ